MNNPEDLLNEYKRLRDGDEREQYVTQEPMSLDEVDRLSNMMNEYKGVEVTPEQQTALQETELAADIASMEPNPEPVIDANEEQKVIDNMSFRDAFEQHYEKVKDLPVSQRPNLLWNKTEYKPVKSEELEPDTDLSKTSIQRPKEDPKKEDVVDRLPNMMNEYKGVEVTPEQQKALQETELAADIASMEQNPEPIIVNLPKKYKSKKTNLNDKLEGYVVSAQDKVYQDIGGLGRVRLTGADKEAGHGAKTVNYVDLDNKKVTTYKDINLGYDFRPDKGEVKAFMPGKVITAGKAPDSPGHGNSVVVKTPKTIKIGDIEYEMYYALGHLKNVKGIKEGQELNQGDFIAKEGNTGSKKYSTHGDIRTFLLPKGSDYKKDYSKKLYVNPIQGYNY